MSRYIDADEVKKAIEESWDGCLGSYGSHEITMNDLWVIDKVQTADVRENVHAHWDKVEVRSGEWWHTCSKCKATWGSEDGELDFNFCPNCGTQMDERREDG